MTSGSGSGEGWRVAVGDGVVVGDGGESVGAEWKKCPPWWGGGGGGEQGRRSVGVRGGVRGGRGERGTRC